MFHKPDNLMFCPNLLWIRSQYRDNWTIPSTKPYQSTAFGGSNQTTEGPLVTFTHMNLDLLGKETWLCG